MIRSKFILPLLTLIALGACDDPPETEPLPTFDEDAGQDGDAGPVRTGPQYAVVNSDFMSTSVSLLGLDGELLADDYINSGSTRPGLVSLLSGDVVMPTQSNDPGVLVLIDRLKTDVITRIRLSDAKVLGQVKTHTPPEQGTDSEYASNPQDYLRVSDDTAWVSRGQPNLNPSVATIDKGNDLLRIDPSSMERGDERIDLSSLDTTATRKNFDTGKEEEVAVYARPTRMARVGDSLVVGLNRAAFDYSAFGSGMVAVIDLDSHKVEAVALPDFVACVYVVPVPGDEERVLVTCSGDFTKERETAGHAIVRVQKGKAKVELTYRSQDYPEEPVLAGSAVALGGTLIGAAANHFSGTEPSVFGVLDLASGEFSELSSIPGGTGTFGSTHYDHETGLLFVPDGSSDADFRPTGGVRVFKRDGDAFEEDRLLKVAEDTTLPVRQVCPL